MTVASILKGKGSDVHSMSPEMSLTAAVAFLCEKRIGAAVVIDSAGGLVGILSERDVVRAMGEHGAAAMEQPVSAFMTEKVQTCTPADTTEVLMRRMTEGRFRHLPVLNDGKLTGIVSIGDVVKSRISELEHETEAMRDYIAGHG
ncbi:MAG: CBS domain-containing protein [Alphaproteobacteria bacterium]|nr:CBS domain-containing protein [Alphaproteobacteria bacterium]